MQQRLLQQAGKQEQKQAILTSMADTKAHATQFAQDAGTTLDDPNTMSETINNGPVPFNAEYAAAPSAGGSAEARVRSGRSQCSSRSM
jgi:uncharacterized protein YggE